MNCLQPPWSGQIKTALPIAIRRENVPLFRTLLEAGANPNIIGWDGCTPLQSAIYTKNNLIVQDLLEAGADINLTGHTLEEYRSLQGDQTAVQIEARVGNSHAVDLLLRAGANVNTQLSGTGALTALLGAAIGGYFEIARMLLKNNAEVNAAASKNGRTAVEGAAERGRIDIVQLLLNAGAEIEGAERGQYNRSLNLAAQNGHYAVCRLLRSCHESRYGTSDSMGT